MSRIPRAVILVATLLAALLLVAACEEADAPEGGAFADLLRFIPDTEETRELVVMVDFARVLEAGGMEAPPPGLSVEEEAAFLVELPPDVRLPRLEYFGVGRTDYVFDATTATRKGLGLGITDMDQFVRAGSPEERLYVMRGRFDAGRATEALDACGECPPAEHGEHRGWEYYAWGGDFGADRGRALAPPGTSRGGASVSRSETATWCSRPGRRGCTRCSMRVKGTGRSPGTRRYARRQRHSTAHAPSRRTSPA